MESMAVTDLLLFFIVSLMIWKLLTWYTAVRLLPPGPWGWPVVGYLPHLRYDRHIVLTNLRKQYGDVYSIRLGKRNVVVLCGHESLRQALVKQGDDFSGRPDFYSFKFVEGGTSLAFCDFGPRWKLRRTITQNAMKNFFNSKFYPVEDLIMREAKGMVAHFLENAGVPVNPEPNIFLSVGGIVYSVCFGMSDVARENPNFVQIAKTMRDFTQFVSAANISDLLPFLRPLVREKFDKFLEINACLKRLLDGEQKKHLDSYKDGQECDNFLDACIKASHEVPQEKKDAVDLSDELITSISGDLIRAGTATVSTTITWAILYLVAKPELQRKLQKEIDGIIGRRRYPCMKDKGKLPLMESFIAEIQRWCSVAPLLLPHATTRDTDLYGYKIPAKTPIIANAYSANHDEAVWENPSLFNPERFITTDGDLDASLVERVVTFSLGRRRCLGEALAKMELFLIVATLLQNCQFDKVPGDDVNLKMQFALVLHPYPYNVIVTKRE